MEATAADDTDNAAHMSRQLYGGRADLHPFSSKGVSRSVSFLGPVIAAYLRSCPVTARCADTFLLVVRAASTSSTAYVGGLLTLSPRWSSLGHGITVQPLHLNGLYQTDGYLILLRRRVVLASWIQ